MRCRLSILLLLFFAGWLQPARNHVPDEQFFLRVAGERFARGLYAHAPSRYEWNLGAKWKTLKGKAGVHAEMKLLGAAAAFGGKLVEIATSRPPCPTCAAALAAEGTKVIPR